jgi:hypothetical protein
MAFALWARAAVWLEIAHECGNQRWLDENYPDIAKRAAPEGAKVHGGNETAPVDTGVCSSGHAPKGRTPVARAEGGRRQKLSMISTLANQATPAGRLSTVTSTASGFLFTRS